MSFPFTYLVYAEWETALFHANRAAEHWITRPRVYKGPGGGWVVKFDSRQ